MATSSGDSRIEQYKELRSDCDSKAYSVKALDQIGDSITSSLSGVIGQFSKNLYGKNNIDSGAKSIQPLASMNRYNFNKAAKNDFLRSKNNAEAVLIKAAKKNNIVIKSIDDIYYDNKIFFKKANFLKDYIGSAAEKVVPSLAEKAVSSGASKGILSFIPGLAIGTDLVFALKNLYEAFVNGKEIISNLPLEKYNIDITNAIMPTPSNTKNISSRLESLLSTYENDPVSLGEILKISQTLKAYGTDFVSTITNFLAVILDVIELDPTRIGFLASMAASIPLVGIEIANDILVESSYESIIDKIRNICDIKISPNETLEFSQREKDFMKALLEDSGTNV